MKNIQIENLLDYFTENDNWEELSYPGSEEIQHFKKGAYKVNSNELPDYEELYELLAKDLRVTDLEHHKFETVVNEIWIFKIDVGNGEPIRVYQIDVWTYHDVTPYEIRRWDIGLIGC